MSALANGADSPIGANLTIDAETPQTSSEPGGGSAGTEVQIGRWRSTVGARKPPLAVKSPAVPARAAVLHAG